MFQVVDLQLFLSNLKFHAFDVAELVKHANDFTFTFKLSKVRHDF